METFEHFDQADDYLNCNEICEILSLSTNDCCCSCHGEWDDDMYSPNEGYLIVAGKNIMTYHCCNIGHVLKDIAKETFEEKYKEWAKVHRQDEEL